MKIYLSGSENENPQSEFLDTARDALEHAHDIETEPNQIIDCDLVVAEITHSSSTQKTLLASAHANSIPIIGLYRKGKIYPESINKLSKDIYHYSDIAELTEALKLMSSIVKRLS